MSNEREMSNDNICNDCGLDDEGIWLTSCDNCNRFLCNVCRDEHLCDGEVNLRTMTDKDLIEHWHTHWAVSSMFRRVALFIEWVRG